MVDVNMKNFLQYYCNFESNHFLGILTFWLFHVFGKAEKIYNMNAAELTSTLQAFSDSRQISRRPSILPYDGSEMILPIMMHSNSNGTLRREHSKRQSVIPYDGSEMILPAIVHSNRGTMRRDGTLVSTSNPHQCCSCDKTSYSTLGHGSSHQTRYSDLEI